MLTAWMLDVARDQSPGAETLTELVQRSRESGYDALGLYLEHRFAYPSAPWAAAPGAVTPETVRTVSAAARAVGLRLIPFLNTLGHMEGFIRSEGGQWLAEREDAAAAGNANGAESSPPGLSLQMCPSRPECVALARGLVVDAMEAFDDEWVHLGGDETRQLGRCGRCAERVAKVGKAGLYAEFYRPLCEWVLERGRRPCLWADMLLEHPQALDTIPRRTLLFDWQYFNRPRETTQRLRAHGFDVICCPSVQSYNSGWCFWPQTRRNIDEHVADARACGAAGVLLTTWECTFFSTFESIAPLVFAAGRRMAHGADWDEALAAEEGESFVRAAEVLGERIPAASRFLAPGTWRRLREHFVMRGNPFSLWRAWRDQACGAAGDEILRLCDEAAAGLPPDHVLQGPIGLHRTAVRWVRTVQAAAECYARGELAAVVERLHTAAALLDGLRPWLEGAAQRGGSRADLARLGNLVEFCTRVIGRVEALADGGLTSGGEPTSGGGPASGRSPSAWRPSFETLTSTAYTPGDQAGWI